MQTFKKDRFMRIISIGLLSLIFNMYADVFNEKVHYDFTTEPLDVVIPCHIKDRKTLEPVISGIKNNIRHRRIIIVAREKLTENAEWFDERAYPFSMAALANEIFQNESQAMQFIHDPKSRMGWIYQQLLKLYAAYITFPDYWAIVFLLIVLEK